MRIECTWIAAAALLMSVLASTAWGQARMVQPESLEQGFIVVVNDKAKLASTESPIFMASSHNGWNPGDQKMKLSRRSDGKWQIAWKKPTLDSRVAFKFTRGSWDSVEMTAGFENIDNRLLPEIDASKLSAGEQPVIELSVEAWGDQRELDPAKLAGSPYREIKVNAGSIRRVDVLGGGAGPIRRDLIVWLPPGYDDPANAGRDYAVLYMLDGQNVFDTMPGVPGEWKADETAAKLMGEGKIEPIIIVGIPHAGVGRPAEYLPFAALDGVEPNGGAFVQFLVDEVVPRIDRSFRTKTLREHRGIGGASLGGIMALEAGTEKPAVFGKVLAESTPLITNRNAGFNHFAAKRNWPLKVYFGMGGRESGDAKANERYVASAQAFEELLAGKGLGKARAKFVIDPEARHDENAWAARFGTALEFLFPAE